MAAGLDSIAATELARKLGGQFAVELPSTMLFDHPTTSTVVHFITNELKGRLGRRSDGISIVRSLH
jgi:acyl carrier protein